MPYKQKSKLKTHKSLNRKGQDRLVHQKLTVPAKSTLKKACCGIPTWDPHFPGLMLNQYTTLLAADEDGPGSGSHSRLYSGLIVAGTVNIWCTERSSPFQYCCPTLASGHQPCIALPLVCCLSPHSFVQFVINHISEIKRTSLKCK